MNSSFSKRLGEVLAHVQDLFDTALHLGIKRVTESGKKSDSDGNEEVSRPGKILKFFGEVGDSYFEKYGHIKSDKNNPNKE
ncbi:MAG: hypothetical protein CMG71_02490 [Candidatus Marinimicrobia bacterium]|nr:hypothetical protein [Candidatus Neomarinimicrobiota bacterium]|tara:strand:- start:8866 stop:9108 length:243 start_codon:yes stop_codon:yes gene_type:complete